MARKIELYGIGFNPNGTDTSIEVKLDGEIIYNGTVSTDTTQRATGLKPEKMPEDVIASWIEADAEATRTLSIRAISGDILYTDSASTYIDETEGEAELDVHIFTNGDSEDVVSDPNKNVLLDNTPLENGRPEIRTELFGQWSISIPEGSTMTCDFVISTGKERPTEVV